MLTSSRNNWERLVAAVVKKQQIWELCHQQSRTPSICSTATSDDFSEQDLSSNRRQGDARSGDGEGSTSSSSRRAAKPKLDRRKARKNINYSPSSASARSLDLYGGRTSFRIEGIDGEIEILCKNLGFSGIDDFSIAPEEYEAMKIENPTVRNSDNSSDDTRDNFEMSRSRTNVIGSRFVDLFLHEVRRAGLWSENVRGRSNELRGSGIKGVLAPVLAPPPNICSSVTSDDSSEQDLSDFDPFSLPPSPLLPSKY